MSQPPFPKPEGFPELTLLGDQKGAFVPAPNLDESERREFEIVLEVAGFTADIKKMVINSPGGAAAKAMLAAAVSVLGLG